MIRSHSTWIEIISDLQWSSVLIMLRVAAIYFTSKEVPIDLQLKLSLEEEEVVVNSPYLCGSPTKRSRFMDVIHSFNDTVVTCLSLYTFVLFSIDMSPPVFHRPLCIMITITSYHCRSLVLLLLLLSRCTVNYEWHDKLIFCSCAREERKT